MTKVAACAALVLGLGCAVDDRSLKLRGDSDAGDQLDTAVPSEAEVVQPMGDASCPGTLCPGDCVLNLDNDSHNCGRCNYECAVGLCDTGSCRILSGLNIPGAIAVDATHVYWLEPYLGKSSVHRATLDGREDQVLASDTDQITALAVDSSYAYWVAPTRGVVMKVALAGGDAMQVATIEGPQGIAIDANNLYVTSSISDPTLQGSVLQIPKAGGPSVTLVPMLQLPRNIAVNATHVYWTDFMAAGLGRALIQQGAGGGSEMIVTAQYGAHGLALGKDYAYWGFLDNGGNMGGIGKIHMATKVKTSLASNVRPGEIAADANHVYWIEVSSLSVAGKSKIMRVAVGGGASELLWAGETPRDIAVDETSVYWTVSARSSDLNKGSLWKHAK